MQSLLPSNVLMSLFHTIPPLGYMWWRYIDFIRQRWLWYKIVVLQKRFPRITKEYKVIFTHIPKAAGVSLRIAIMGKIPFDKGIPGHIPIKYYQMSLGNDINHYFKFTFVRHPVARLYSAYKFLKKGGWKKNNFKEDLVFSTTVLYKFHSFEEFVDWLTPSTRFIYIHFYPQVYFLVDTKGQILQDFIGKVETIDKDYKKLTDILKKRGLKSIAPSLPKANITTMGKIPNLPKYILDKIHDLYYDDFTLLNYDPEFF